MKAVKTSGSKKAFTLIELLFVLIIVGILVAVAGPRIKRSLYSLEAEAAASQIKSVMGFLQQKALQDAKTMRLSFDAKSGRYSAQDAETKTPLKTYSLPGSVTVETQNKEVYFYPDGSIDKADIIIRGEGNKTITLTTKGVWGGVKKK